MKGCDNPTQCPAIKDISDELKITHANYATSQAISVNTQKALAENTKSQSEINVTLVKATADLGHLCAEVKEERKNNKQDHDTLFNRTRDNEKKTGKLETTVEKKLGVINTNQATKLSTWDLLKIVMGMCSIFGFFLLILKYTGAFGG